MPAAPGRLGQGRPGRPGNLAQGRPRRPARHHPAHRIRWWRRRFRPLRGVQRRVRPGWRERRLLRHALRRDRPLHQPLRQRRTETEMAAGHLRRRNHPRHRHDRTRHRQRPESRAHHRRTRWRRVRDQWQQDLHQQRPDRRPGDRRVQDRPGRWRQGHQPDCRGNLPCRLQAWPQAGKGRPARPGHRRAVLRQRPCTGGQPPGRGRPGLHLPDGGTAPGAFFHRRVRRRQT
ncbi:hypothetical protein D3C85_1212160 [compost metagenome]